MDLKNILNTAHEKELDSLLILKPENIVYLSGYKPSSFSILLGDTIDRFADWKIVSRSFHEWLDHLIMSQGDYYWDWK